MYALLIAAAVSAGFVDSVAGVYKTRFKNALVDGSKYDSENILEVVPFGDGAAYVRMDLQFFNGHVGGISGIATFDAKAGDTLIYDGPGDSEKVRCVVKYVFTDKSVKTEATYPGCSTYHGARGTLTGAEWPAKAKRAIKYMERLKKSSQYGAAVTEFEAKAPPQPTAPPTK